MKTLFKCNYCAFTDEDPNVVEDHEKNCLYNPVFKNCASCNQLDVVQVDYPCPICKVGYGLAQLRL